MQRIIVLGSAAAVSSATRDNTFLAFESQKDVILLFIMIKCTAPLPVYANRATLRVVKGILGIMRLEPDFLIFSEVPKEEGYIAIDNEENLLTSKHTILRTMSQIVERKRRHHGEILNTRPLSSFQCNP